MNMRSLILTCLMLLPLPCAAEAPAVAGEYVITLSPVKALRAKTLQGVRTADRAARVASESKHVALFKGQGGRDLCGKVRRYERRERLRMAKAGRHALVRTITCEPNAILSALVTPNDPMFSQQWGYMDSPYGLSLQTAWASHTGSRGVVVAVIDTGVDYNHDDLKNNIWTNKGEIPGNGIDDDGNGYVDDVHGYNFVSDNGDPLDDHGHGTHCSGTIGAQTNNGLGVSGVNWNVQIIGVKFLSSSGSGSLYNAVRSIDYVTALKAHGTPVLLSSNSWGGGGYYQALKDAISRANDADILFVAAAGNSHIDSDTSPQ